MSSSRKRKTSSPPPVSSSRATLLALALIIAVTLAVRAPLLNIPFERDEGEYAYIGWRLGYNELPYRDWIDQKPPAIFWVYRLALGLPLEPIRAVHLVGIIFAAASACALFFLARRFINQNWAVIAAIVFALLLADPMINGTAANTELFMLLPLILSQLAFFAVTENGRRRLLLMISCGALTGLAAAFKQVAAINWLFLIVIFPLFVTPEKRWRRTFEFAFWSTLGAAGVWGMIAIYFWSQHSLGALVYNVFTHNLEYVRAISWSVRWQLCQMTLANLAPAQAITWAMAVVGLIGQLLAGRRQSFFFWLGALLTSAIGVSAGGYFFAHYFQQLLPALAVCAVLGAAGICSARWLRALPTWLPVAALSVAIFLLPVIRLWPFLTRYTPSEAVRKIYPGNFFAEMPELGSRLQKATSPDDKVFIFGSEPEILFYAQRVSATRYIFLNPLYGPYADALPQQQAAAEEITANKPAAAISYPNRLFRLPGSELYFTRWSDAYLRENFHTDAHLVIDPGGELEIMPAVGDQPPALAPGQRLLGGMFLRTN